MKTAIIGYSGSGKSTLAAKLAKKDGVAVLHLDTVQFLPGWEIREDEEKKKIVKAFLDKNESYVIDGNYSKLFYERRMNEADRIIFMNFNRLACLFRVIKRYRIYKGKSRESMTCGCDERLTREFLRWVVWDDGRVGKRKRKLTDIAKKYKDKTVVIKNQRALDKFEKENDL